MRVPQVCMLPLIIAMNPGLVHTEIFILHFAFCILHFAFYILHLSFAFKQVVDLLDAVQGIIDVEVELRHHS